MVRMGVEPADDWRRGVVVDTPRPSSPPKFELAPDAVSGTPLWPVQEILDGAFFVIGTALVMWLGWIVVTVGIDGWLGISSVFLFWVLLAYVGLPRLQEVLSKIYVPDYFIGRSLTDVGVLRDCHAAIWGFQDMRHFAALGTHSQAEGRSWAWGIALVGLPARPRGASRPPGKTPAIEGSGTNDRRGPRKSVESILGTGPCPAARM
jgi:hypothetical protein